MTAFIRSSVCSTFFLSNRLFSLSVASSYFFLALITSASAVSICWFTASIPIILLPLAVFVCLLHHTFLQFFTDTVCSVFYVLVCQSKCIQDIFLCLCYRVIKTIYIVGLSCEFNLFQFFYGGWYRHIIRFFIQSLHFINQTGVHLISDNHRNKFNEYLRGC